MTLQFSQAQLLYLVNRGTGSILTLSQALLLVKKQLFVSSALLQEILWARRMKEKWNFAEVNQRNIS